MQIHSPGVLGFGKASESTHVIHVDGDAAVQLAQSAGQLSQLLLAVLARYPSGQLVKHYLDVETGGCR